MEIWSSPPRGQSFHGVSTSALAAMLVVAFSWLCLPGVHDGWENAGRLPTDQEINQAASAALATIQAEDSTTYKCHVPSIPVSYITWANEAYLIWIVPNPDYRPVDDPDYDPDELKYHCNTTPLQYDGSWFFNAAQHNTYGGNDLPACLDYYSTWYICEPGFVGESQPGQNQPPTVKLSYSVDNTLRDAEIYDFVADASDPDGDVLTYTWFVNGEEQDATHPNVEWTNPPEGTFTVKVVVSDGKGGIAQDSVTFSRGNKPPRVELLANVPYGTPQPVFVSEYGFTSKYSFQANSTDANREDVVTHTWFFDGQQVLAETRQTNPGADVSTATSFVDWVNPSRGTHTVMVKASDGNGGTEEKSHTFTVMGNWIHLRVVGGHANVALGKEMQELGKGTEISITADVLAGDEIRVNCLDGSDVRLVFGDGSTMAFECWSAIVGLGPEGGGLVKLDPHTWEYHMTVGPGDARVHVRNVRITNFETPGFHGGKLGTEYEIVVKPDGSSTIYTFEGTVWIADIQERKTVYVHAGETSTGVSGSAPSDARPFDPESMERWWKEGTEPPGNGQSLAVALDANGNGTLDDAEIRQAIQYWILGQTVPGANQVIDDTAVRQLIQLWILGGPVSARAAGPIPLNTHALSVRALHPLEWEIAPQAPDVATLQVQLYDLSGRLLLDESTTGRRLRFDLRTNAGAPLANGVYLYVITARGADGATWRSETGKLVAMR